MKQFIGIDIGGTKCAVLLGSAKRGLVVDERVEFPTRDYPDPMDCIAHMQAIMDELIIRRKITAIGISCGGPLDSKRGLIQSPPNLPGWDEIPIVELFEKKYRLPTFLQNDANAGALVEWKLGAGRNTDNMVFLTMGTGMGAGIIAEGKLLCGNNDLAGEVGHLRLASDGPIGFGKHGSFEGFCSGGGIARFALTYVESLENKPTWYEQGMNLTTKELSNLANSGDADAIRIFELVGQKLGSGISILLDVLNPQVIAIGGIFMRCEKLLRPTMEREIAREALPLSASSCSIVPAQVGERIGDYASLMVALYGMGIDCMEGEVPLSLPLQYLFDDLFQRYPDLADQRDNVLAMYQTLSGCYKHGGKLLVCGNGGSASDAEHIVGELMKGFFKRRPLPKAQQEKLNEVFAGKIADAGSYFQGALQAISLTGHTSLSTAFLNDVHPELVFAQQVLGYGRVGDVLLCISTSGNSKNVVHAARMAKSLGLQTVALTGPNPNSQLQAIADVTVCAGGKNTAQVQERHLPIYHTLCAMLEEEFFEE